MANTITVNSPASGTLQNGHHQGVAVRNPVVGRVKIPPGLLPLMTIKALPMAPCFAKRAFQWVLTSPAANPLRAGAYNLDTTMPPRRDSTKRTSGLSPLPKCDIDGDAYPHTRFPVGLSERSKAEPPIVLLFLQATAAATSRRSDHVHSGEDRICDPLHHTSFPV